MQDYDLKFASQRMVELKIRLIDIHLQGFK